MAARARAGIAESGKAPIDLPRPSVDNP
jgi:hypothetical protein